MARGSAALGGAGQMGIGGKSLGTTRKGRGQDQTLVDLRERNRSRRLIRNLRRIYGYGLRATGKLAIELATRVDALSVLEELAQQFADKFDPDLLRAIGCHDFPGSPLYVVSGGRR